MEDIEVSAVRAIIKLGLRKEHMNYTEELRDLINYTAHHVMNARVVSLLYDLAQDPSNKKIDMLHTHMVAVQNMTPIY